jgi:hypothetical protein
VCEAEIEQHRLVGIRGPGQLIDIEAMAEGGDLVGQHLIAERDRLPRERLAGQREDVAFVVARQEEHQRFVRSEQLLRIRGGERLGACQCCVVGELLFEPGRNGVQLALGIGNRCPQRRDRRRVLLALRL